LADPKQKNLLDIAQSASEALKFKVDDLLDFYELETNRFKVKKEFFSVTEQIKKIEIMYSPLINKKAISLSFYVHEEVPHKIYQDQARIMQILVNLVGNAVKYTSRGRIAVIVSWNENKNQKGEVISSSIKYVVSDTGGGIPESKKKSLFKFLQHDLYKDIDRKLMNSNEETTKLAGTGLGVSQKITVKLGGEIKFISTLDVGSKFWFELPAEAEGVKYDIYSHSAIMPNLKKNFLNKFKKNSSRCSNLLMQESLLRIEESKLYIVILREH
jgi:signal transduction histidine kinase